MGTRVAWLPIWVLIVCVLSSCGREGCGTTSEPQVRSTAPIHTLEVVLAGAITEPTALSDVAAVTEVLKNLPGVESVVSLDTLELFEGGANMVTSRPAVEMLAVGRSNVPVVAALYPAYLAPDGRATRITALLETPLAEASLQQLVQELEGVLPEPPPGVARYLSARPVETALASATLQPLGVATGVDIATHELGGADRIEVIIRCAAGSCEFDGEFVASVEALHEFLEQSACFGSVQSFVPLLENVELAFAGPERTQPLSDYGVPALIQLLTITEPNISEWLSFDRTWFRVRALVAEPGSTGHCQERLEEYLEETFTEASLVLPEEMTPPTP